MFGVTAVLDGHTHQVYDDTEKDKDNREVLITQAGSKLSHIGVLKITGEEISSEIISEIPEPGDKTGAIQVLRDGVNRWVDIETHEMLKSLFLEKISTDVEILEIKDTTQKEIKEFTTNIIKETTETIEQIKECDISCSKCLSGKDDINICLECNTEKGYYPIYGDNSTCYNNETIKEGYFLDKTEFPYKWKQCFYKCATCNGDGNEKDMKCLSCNINLINNITKKQIFLELLNNNCIEQCPRNTFITPDKNCVSACPNGTYIFSLNNSCLEQCPSNYKINMNKECIFTDCNEDTTKEQFKTQIINNISSYVNSSKVYNGSNFISAISTTDNMNVKEQIKNGISAVDLGNCTQIIKDYYNISNEESLILMNIENKKNESNKLENKALDVGKITELEVYDMSGRKLDLSVCKEDINVMKYVGDVEKLDIQTAKDLVEKGIDVFNLEDSFFQDLCQSYDNPDGKDIILKDRQTYIYQNVTFCQDGCTYMGMDYNLNAANCKCNSSYLQSKEKNETNNNDNEEQTEKVNLKTITKTFISSLEDFNFKVLKCNNLVTDMKILAKNIGFNFLSSMLVLELLFFVIFMTKGLKPLKQYIFSFINNNKENNNKDDNNINNNNNNSNKIMNPPPHKEKLELKSKRKENKIIKYSELNNDSTTIKKILPKNELINNNNIIKNLNENQFNLIGNQIYFNNANKKRKKEKNIFTESERENIHNSKKQSEKLKINNNKNNEKKEKKIESKSNRKKSRKKNKLNLNKNEQNIYNIETDCKKIDGLINNVNNINNNINTINQTKFPQIEIDLLDLDYEEAIILDKRSIIKIYFAYLINSIIILDTFCSDNNLNLIIIKLSFLICTFQISFLLNALFYTDEYISNAYHNNGVLDFVSGLPKSIYSFVATLIITNLLKILSNSKSELIKLILAKPKPNNYEMIINMKINKLRVKLAFYYILVFSLGIFFLYYVTAFCAVYKYSQKYLALGFLESFAIDTLVSIAACAFMSLFRYISLKTNIKYFYSLSNIIGLLF